MSTCNVFDKYRDGELSPAERSAFEEHLAVCADCGSKTALLNNIVYAMQQERINPVDQADLIAQKAFSRGTRWDALVVSWLRPGPALAALTLVLVLFSFLWIIPGSQPINAYSEYERLMDETVAIDPDVSVPQTGNDIELVLWMNQEGYSQ
jgi:hypothetical protein